MWTICRYLVLHVPLPVNAQNFFVNNAYWWAIINLLITLTGILFLGWSLQPIIFLFWMEVIFNLVAAFIRVMGAMDGQPFLHTLWRKVLLLFFGSIMGTAMIMLAFSFTIGVFDKEFDTESFRGISASTWILGGNYAVALLTNFFFNGRFRKADPVTELVSTFVYLLILLVLIMAVTQHLIPALKLQDANRWVGLGVVGVKFAVDMGTMSLRTKTPVQL